MENTILTIENLGKNYTAGSEKIIALNDFQLHLNSGEIFGLLGPNGAGKTTIVKLIMGLLTPSTGRILFRQTPLTAGSSRHHFAYLPENFHPNPNLTVHEYLTFHLELRAIAVTPDALLPILTKVGLASCGNRRIRTLSKGMTQRLALAQSLIGSPSLCIFDEPTSGLDPIGRSEVIDLLLDLKNRGKTLFFCSHILSEVERICDRIGILVAGNLSFCGTVDQFLHKWSTRSLEESFRKEVQCFSA